MIQPNTYKMKMICNMDGPACSKLGILHAQSESKCCVPKDTPAATREPTK